MYKQKSYIYLYRYENGMGQILINIQLTFQKRIGIIYVTIEILDMYLLASSKTHYHAINISLNFILTMSINFCYFLPPQKITKS